MQNSNHLEALFRQALQSFPYQDLEPTSVSQGDLERDSDDFIEYGEEFTFEVGKLLDESLQAGGWIELRRDTPHEDPTITAFFGIARSGDWERGRILPETTALQGLYDIKRGCWDLWIDQY